MSNMRKMVRDLEIREGIKVKCPVCGYRCRYCPLASLSRCRKLRRRLESGEWR